MFTKPLAIIYQPSCLFGEVPVDWWFANVMPIYNKGQKESQRNYRPVTLTLESGKLIKQMILSAMWHLQGNQVIRPSQYGFMKGRSCLTKMICFYSKLTCSVDEGKTVDVIYLDFSKAFGTVFHNIHLEKLAAHGLGGCMILWVKSSLGGQAQRVKANGIKFSCRPVTSGVSQS